MEIYRHKLDSGRVLIELWTECDDSDGYASARSYGFIEMLPDGKARLWDQVWVDEYRPHRLRDGSEVIFPGFISAARALKRGEY